MLTGFIVMFVGVAVGIFGKKIMLNEIVAFVGILLSLLGMFFTVYPHLMPPRRRKPDLARVSQTEQLNQTQFAKTLPQERPVEYVPSITERTTNLLETAPAAKPKANEDGERQA